MEELPERKGGGLKPLLWLIPVALAARVVLECTCLPYVQPVEYPVIAVHDDNIVYQASNGLRFLRVGRALPSTPVTIEVHAQPIRNEGLALHYTLITRDGQHIPIK